MRTLPLLLLAVCLTACGCRHLSSFPAYEESPSSFCDLLALPERPYPALLPKPYLGIYLEPKAVTLPDVCEKNSVVRIAGVIDNSPAAQAGIREDDIILALNRMPVCADEQLVVQEFKSLIEQQRVGAPLIAEVLRGDRKITLTVTLEEQTLHVQRESAHPGAARCPDQASALERALAARNALPLFEKLQDNLYRRTNTVHNPGLAVEREAQPLQLSRVTSVLRHPEQAGIISRELAQKVLAPFSGTFPDLGAALRASASLLDVELPAARPPAAYDLPALLSAMEAAAAGVERALKGLSPDERDLLRSTGFPAEKQATWNTVLAVMKKADQAQLLEAFSPLLALLTQDGLAILREDIIRRFGGSRDPVLYEAATSLGMVVVGGIGPNTYKKDAALILDLGGDDLYLNNAGGTRPGMTVSLVIDWGGNDRYLGRENCSQGAGFLGGGFLLDLGGNDTFLGMDGSQGAALLGMGVLYHGDGSSDLSARRYSQGTGQMGIGLLANKKGESRYLCSYGCQGLGRFGGTGILIDGSGNDLYQTGGLEPDFRDPAHSTQSFAQGFGNGIRAEKNDHAAPGGIGMLLDGAGDDTYLADYFAQGASYYFGLGILYDASGNDRYLSGRYSQGAGIHTSAGVLIDLYGDDFYYSSFGVAQGMGHDFGIGFLEDGGGRDRYQGGTLVQGAATAGGVGLLLDGSGSGSFSSGAQGQAYASGGECMGIMVRGAGNNAGVLINRNTGDSPVKPE